MNSWSKCIFWDFPCNFKKVLALVLAFACAFTMFAGAAFTDSADIKVDTEVVFCYNCYGFVTAGIITKVLFFVKFSGLSASSCRCFSIERGSRKPRFTRLPAVFCAFCQFFVFMKIFLRKYLFNNLINQHVHRVFFRSFGCRLTLRNTFRRKSAPELCALHSVGTGLFLLYISQDSVYLM